MVDMATPELAEAQCQDRIRDAQKIRPHATLPRTTDLPSILRSLRRIIARFND